jgi:hypothetical protein
MAETRLVVERREQLWSLLVEAAQYEHMIMCQYLYAECAIRDGVPEVVSSAATIAATISEQLAGHLPQDLRPWPA